MIYLIHTELGYIKEAVQSSTEGGPSAPFGYRSSGLNIERSELPNINTVYVNTEGNSLDYSIYRNIRVDREVIAADGESETNVLGLPEEPCELMVGNQLIKVTNGEFKYKSSKIGSTSIRLVGKFTSNVLTVEALTMDSLREIFRLKVKEMKSKTEDQGAWTPLGIIDVDSSSLTKILINLQRVDEPNFTINWTMKDNSVVAHNKEQFIELSKAASNFTDLLQSRKNALCRIITKCNTLGQLERVPINIGWPT